LGVKRKSPERVRNVEDDLTGTLTSQEVKGLYPRSRALMELGQMAL